MIQIKYKIDDGAYDLTKTYADDAGWDIKAIDRTVEKRNGILVITYNTGISFEIPKGYFMDIRSRSSVKNTGMWLSNGVGTIDATYRGPVSMVFYKVGNQLDGTEYNIGDRIGQIVFPQIPIYEISLLKTDKLSDTERGSRGYGSTGLN
jgi:dUTP pyrophosphatase